MAKLSSGVAEDRAPDVARDGDFGAREAAGSLAPSGGSVASNGQAAAAASAVGGMRHRRAGSTVRVQDKVLLDAAIEVEKTRRLAAGDPAAATIVGRNIDCDALLKQGLAETPGLERALALAKQYDAQLKGVSADQELGLATARAYDSYDTPESDDQTSGSPDGPIGGAGRASNPESASLQSTPPEGMSLEVAGTDADILPTVAGAGHEGPAAKRRLGGVIGMLLAAGIAAALLFTGKCAVESPDATLAASKAEGSSSTAASERSAQSAATAPRGIAAGAASGRATSTAASAGPAGTEGAPNPHGSAHGSGAAAPTTSGLSEANESPSAQPAATIIRPYPSYRPRKPKHSPYIIHPGGQ